MMNYEAKIAHDPAGLDYVDRAGGTPPVMSEADIAAEKRKQRRLTIIAIVLTAAALGLIYIFTHSSGSSTEPKASDAKQVPNVTVVVPGRQTVTNTVNATGTLAARREMPVGVAGEGGLVTNVFVEQGSWVRAGQVLASIERSVQTQESAQLAANIVAAQSDARLAQAELDRSIALLSRGFISKADIDRRTATRDAARARVKVAEAQLAANRARIGRLDIRAPESGLVLTRSVEPGQIVGPGSGVLFRMAKGGEMELRAELAEGDLARMAVGQRAMVTPVGSGRSFTGEIWQLSPVIDPATRQGIARIALGYDPVIRPGGFAEAKIVAGSASVPLLPESAVQSDAKGNFVYVIDDAKKVARRDVRLGIVTDTGAAIMEGLSGLEQVVLSAGAFLNPGERVNPVRKVLQ